MSSSLLKRPKELIIIDGNIGDIESILTGLNENQRYIILSGGNGFVPLLEYLEISGIEWSAFHFITHGNDASFTLNGTTVSQDNLCSEDWLNIGKYLTDDGDILLYGCNIAVSDEGKALVNAITALTGADTAASVDISGFGGNNILEYHSGAIETASVLPGTFSGSLEWIDQRKIILPASSVTFTGTTFGTSSFDGDGGIVYNEGTFAASTCTFSNNSASNNGGAVQNKGIFEATFSTFSNNSASNNGGAVYNNGTFTADNCTFIGNSVNLCYGGAVFNSSTLLTIKESLFIANCSHSGGAIYSDKGTLIITGSIFVGNTAGYGGAICSNADTLTITGSFFSSNKVSGSGGAIYSNADTLTITGSTFAGNNTEGSGGAVDHSGTFTASTCTFSNNSASNNGGAVQNKGIFEATFSTFSNNSASDSGGVVYNNSGTFTASTSMFSDNTAVYGGAVYNYYGKVTINNSTFCDNSASDSGGAVYNTEAGTVSLNDCIFTSENDTVYNAGTLILSGANTFGGSVTNEGTVVFDLSSMAPGNETVIVDDISKFSGGSYRIHLSGTPTKGTYLLAGNAEAFNAMITLYIGSSETGLDILPGNAVFSNGTLYSLKKGKDATQNLSLTIADTAIITAEGTTETLTINGIDYTGVGLTNDDLADALANLRTVAASGITSGTSLTVRASAVFATDNVNFENGTSDNSGGAVHNSGTFTASGSTFSRSTAEFSGGAVHNSNMFTAKNCMFNNNSATHGGAVENSYHDTFTATSCSFSGNIADNGGAVDNNDGTVITTSCSFSGNTANYGGAVHNNSSFTATSCSFSRNSATKGGGAVFNCSYGMLKVTASTFSGNTATQKGGAVHNESGTVFLKDCVFTTESDTIYNASTLSLSGANTFAGAVTNEGIVVFDLSSMTSGNETLIVDDFSKFNGGSYSVTISDKHAYDTYLLAGNAEAFSGTISVTGFADEETLVLGVNVAREYNGKNYIFSRDDTEKTLFFQISENIAVTALTGNKDGVTWTSTDENPAKAVFATDDSFSEVLSVIAGENAVATYGVPGREFSWGVQAGGAVIQAADGTISGESSGTPSQLTAQDDGVTDLFFANALGQWEIGYVAKHTGMHSGNENSNDWEGTGDRVYLAGKNKIGDIISGVADANILVLTDDANGDALFVDDLYTDAPGDKKEESRLSKIQEVRAGAGNDVIDLTSSRFSYSCHQNGLTIRGGSGDDVIWANNGSNFLFGDDGNDRIVGGNGNDVISGGSGNDQLHGGGGNDVFTFCEGWGEDTVMQLDGGNVTLWFAEGSIENWDARTMTYTDGSNSVTVSGVTEDKVSLKFGDDGSEEYDRLSAQGAFSEKTSEKIFETDKTLLA